MKRALETSQDIYPYTVSHMPNRSKSLHFATHSHMMYPTYLRSILQGGYMHCPLNFPHPFVIGHELYAPGP